jgi:hypothetical protein
MFFFVDRIDHEDLHEMDQMDGFGGKMNQHMDG